ncbi:COX15/CtaA family protein [Vibrio gangliei]|uniref:COX15/CtaA family protein n=1 Tax=Vibrio gangliei TaxID=2077090 RepID=UPI000D01FD88|nr:COX15/CtaA family protein [Vibrio gangliei]
MDNIKPLLWLVRASIALALLVIVLGAYTRISDAGLGCPDWPGCYGQIIVPVHNDDVVRASQLFPGHVIDPHKAWLEMIHRYVAGMLGLLILAIVMVSWRLRQVSNTLPIGLASLVIFQAALGMWTVTLKLMPIIVVLHLFGGFALLCFLMLFYLALRPHSWLQHSGLQDSGSQPPLSQPQRNHRQAQFGFIYKKERIYKKEGIDKKGKITNIDRVNKLYRVGWLALSVLLVQIFLGGWTSSNYAALVCTQLPVCEGNWWQSLHVNGAFTLFQHPLVIENGSYEYGVLDYSSRMTIHVFHRIGALVTAITLFNYAWRIWQAHLSLVFQRAAIGLALLVALQISLGLLNVVLHLPVILAVAHNLVAALLLLNIVFIHSALYLCYLQASRQTYSTHTQPATTLYIKPNHIAEKVKLKGEYSSK